VPVLLLLLLLLVSLSHVALTAAAAAVSDGCVTAPIRVQVPLCLCLFDSCCGLLTAVRMLAVSDTATCVFRSNSHAAMCLFDSSPAPSAPLQCYRLPAPLPCAG
jgi:hypothetical protein